MNLLRIKTVAVLLDITERTIWNKIKRGELPTITVAGITRIDGDRLSVLMGNQPTQSTIDLVSTTGTEHPMGVL